MRTFKNIRNIFLVSLGLVLIFITIPYLIEIPDETIYEFKSIYNPNDFFTRVHPSGVNYLSFVDCSYYGNVVGRSVDNNTITYEYEYTKDAFIEQLVVFAILSLGFTVIYLIIETLNRFVIIYRTGYNTHLLLQNRKLIQKDEPNKYYFFKSKSRTLFITESGNVQKFKYELINKNKNVIVDFIDSEINLEFGLLNKKELFINVVGANDKTIYVMD